MGQLRVRNLHFLVLKQCHGIPVPVIAAYARVSERTVRRGIADARTYRTASA